MAGHGSVGRYNAGCRCERCRGAIADYRRARRHRGQDGGTTSSGPRAAGPSTRTSPRTSPSGAGSRATAKVRAPAPSTSPSPSAAPRSAARPFIAGASPSRSAWTRPGGRPAARGHQGVDSVADVWRPVAGIPLSLAPAGAPAVAADPRRRPVHGGSVDPAPASTVPTPDEVRVLAARQLGQRRPESGGPFGGRSATSSTRTLWRRLMGR